MDTPSGWVQITRGPRPLSMRWPPSGQPHRQPAQKRPRQPSRPSLQPMQAKSSRIRPFQDPSAKITAAKERISKLETAWAAMAGDGSEVDSVRAAHNKRAQEAVQGVPNDVEVKECEAFLVRPRSHLAELDSKRATVMENIETSKKRLSELRTKLQALPPTEESEVQQLRG